VNETIPAGYARIVTVLPVDEVHSPGDPHCRVEYVTEDGPGSVVLSSQRARQLGMLSPTTWGTITPLPKR
jgi:hypothetical protein